jgi:hypothetical protein
LFSADALTVCLQRLLFVLFVCLFLFDCFFSLTLWRLFYLFFHISVSLHRFVGVFLYFCCGLLTDSIRQQQDERAKEERRKKELAETAEALERRGVLRACCVLSLACLHEQHRIGEVEEVRTKMKNGNVVLSLSPSHSVGPHAHTHTRTHTSITPYLP